MSVATYTKSGSKSSTPAKLDKKVFGVAVDNHDLIHQAYRAYLASGRVNLAKTKKRGEVRGGGKKPHPQKGTGRARFGSSRNPIWRGGGVAFGPTGEENYKIGVNIQAKRQALRQALSLAAKEDKVKVIENFVSSDGKAKQALETLKKMGAKDGAVIVVVDTKETMAVRATNNLSNVILVSAGYLNVYDVVNADQLIFTKPGLAKVEERLGGTK